MSDNYLTIKDGTQPVLVVSIHSCHTKSPTNPERKREAKATKMLNEVLHEEYGYYSFIYTGYRTRCIKDTKKSLIEIIERMLNIYDRIGVMSLHGRAEIHTIKSHPDSIFELGTLHGKTLDASIAADLRDALGKDNIVFDYDHNQTGGGEIRFMHRIFNDPYYKRGKVTPGHNPKNNKLQIAQLEFDDWKEDKDWVKDGIDQRIYLCSILGKNLIDYVTRARH